MSWEEREERTRRFLQWQKEQEERRLKEEVETETRRQLEKQTLIRQAEETLARLKVAEALEGIKAKYWRGEGTVESFGEDIHYLGYGEKTIKRGLQLKTNTLAIEVVGSIESEEMVRLIEGETSLSVFMHPLFHDGKLEMEDKGLWYGSDDDLPDLIRKHGLERGLVIAGGSFNRGWNGKKGWGNNDIYYASTDITNPQAMEYFDTLLLRSCDIRGAKGALPFQMRRRVFSMIDQLPSAFWTEGYLSGPEVKHWATQNNLLPSLRKNTSVLGIFRRGLPPNA